MIDPEVRRLGIGGSEIGAIFGVSEFADQFTIWARKKGGLAPEPASDRMLVGTALEDGVLDLYSIQTGRELLRPKTTFAHPVYPFMVYSPDGICEADRRGVDAKVTFFDQRRNWGDGAADVPPYIEMQCYWYMAAYDWDSWDVAAFMGDGLPHIYTVQRNAEAEKVMLKRAEEWWSRYLVGNERPPFEDSPSAGDWLQAAFPRHKQPDMREATAEEARMIEDYAAVRLLERELEVGEKKLVNQIKLAIADKEGLTFPGGKFTWRRTKDQEEINWEGLVYTLMHLHVPAKADRDKLYADHTTIKEGIRRIRLDHHSLKKEKESAADAA